VRNAVRNYLILNNYHIAPLVEILNVEVICDDRPGGPIKLNLKEVSIMH